MSVFFGSTVPRAVAATLARMAATPVRDRDRIATAPTLALDADCGTRLITTNAKPVAKRYF